MTSESDGNNPMPEKARRINYIASVNASLAKHVFDMVCILEQAEGRFGGVPCELLQWVDAMSKTLARLEAVDHSEGCKDEVSNPIT